MTSDALRQLIAHSLEALPAEACGLLLSRDDDLTIDCIVPIRNSSPSPERRFSFDPRDWIKAFYDAQKNQQHLVGFFHSHPSGAPLPSATDYAGLPQGYGGIYCIVSAAPDAPLVKAYREHDGELHPLGRVCILRG
ncbi:hypothetical protein PA598K_04571 [Paenibacillus sp. 598K]|nr:hypothetical protein PA598K_04571 [Paenibacillus sp. 598K]